MILVTGGTGLVGTHLLQQLILTNNKIKAIYRGNNKPTFLQDNVEWVNADLLDIISLEEAFTDVTHVYHCAASVSFNPKRKRELYQTNVVGTANVVNAALAAGITKMVYVSSVAALGRIREDKPIDETMSWSAETSNSEYGKTKYLAEMEVWRGIAEGLEAAIVNPVIILGAGDWTKGSSEIFKTVYNEFPWYTTGTTGFVDVQDVVKAMMALMNSNISAEQFILSAENVSYQHLFNLIAKAFNKKTPHKKVTPFIAAVVWRLEAIKYFFTGNAPLLTKETTKTAITKASFDNSKLKKFIPDFEYLPLQKTVERICAELKQKHNLV